jgi:serine/threonine-protein kinase
MSRLGIGVALAGVLLLLGCQTPSGDRYGALAVSDLTQRWGSSHDLATQDSAEEAALRHCNADDCRVVVWFADACGAIARGPDYVAWGLGMTRQEAEEAVLADCEAEGCEVIGFSCSTRP